MRQPGLRRVEIDQILIAAADLRKWTKWPDEKPVWVKLPLWLRDLATNEDIEYLRSRGAELE